MGLALAEQAYIRGADVTLVAANVSVRISPLFNVIYAQTSGQMADTIFDIIDEFDIFISTAAVGDFEVADRKDIKISSESPFDISLKPSLKIIREIKKINPSIFLVGFKAEFDLYYDELVKRARKQIGDAGSDMVVVNDVSNENCGFGSDNNKVLIVDDAGVLDLHLMSKRDVSKKIMMIISKKIQDM